MVSVKLVVDLYGNGKINLKKIMKNKEIHWTQNAELIFPEEFRDFSKISGRHPEVRTGVTIEQDVQRRDFTCNALFFDISSKKIIDLVGGVEDIESKLIRCVGNPMDRFREDQLRTLRAVRFAVRMGFEIERSTMDAIVSGADLSDISRERIVIELTKTLDSGHAEKLFDMLVKTGMLHKCFLTRSWKGTREVSATFCEQFHISGHASPSLFLAQVFADTADLTHLEELLHQSKWSTDDVRGCITLLRWERSLSFDTAFSMFRDLQKIRWGTSDSILSITDFKRHFASRGKSDSLMLTLLAEFKTTVKAEELMERGLKGRELGEKITELETQNIKLLWSSRVVNRSKNQTLFLFNLVGGDFERLVALETRIKNCHVSYCPSDSDEVDKIMQMTPDSTWFSMT